MEHIRRRLPMQLAAEIIWNQLPPLTFAANDTIVTAVLEPCYDVGGDAFDYAANGDILHVALFDTVGHGIGASALTTLTLNTYRNARRCGLTLADTYLCIDKWIRAQYPGAFVTAVLAELDTATGHYRRISDGSGPGVRREYRRAPNGGWSSPVGQDGRCSGSGGTDRDRLPSSGTDRRADRPAMTKGG